MRAAVVIAGVLWPALAHAGPQMTAVRRSGDIAIDGRLDEPGWQLAAPFRDFWQRFPDQGQPPTHRSEVRVLYDDDAIYVGVRAADSAPDQLSRALTRYDEWTSADWIVVGFDTYHDRRTAFQFGVNAGGTKFDEILYDDIRNDASWNAVWEGVSAVDAGGWSVEMRIPLSQLRYPDTEEQVWGFQVLRIVQRLEEATVFSPWPYHVTQRVSVFGELRGIRGTSASASCARTWSRAGSSGPARPRSWSGATGGPARSIATTSAATSPPSAAPARTWSSPRSATGSRPD